MATSIYRELAETLKEQIRDKKWTGRMPGRIRLAREMAVHHVTLGKAVDLLVEEGILSVRGTSGTYIAQRNTRKKFNTIGLVGILAGQSTNRMLFAALERQALAAGFTLIGIHFSENLFLENRRVLLNFPVDGFLFRGSSLRKEQSDLLLEQKIPFACSAGSMRLECDTVECDHNKSYHRAFSELKAKGYRKIVFIESARTQEYQYYLDSIREAMQDALGDDFVSQHFYAASNLNLYYDRYGETYRDHYIRDTLEHFKKIGIIPDVIVCPFAHFSTCLFTDVPFVKVASESEAPSQCNIIFGETNRLLTALNMLIERCNGYDGPFRHEFLDPYHFDLSNIPTKSK